MGRPMPYQPMRTTRKEVSQADMWAKLSKHVPKEVMPNAGTELSAEQVLSTRSVDAGAASAENTPPAVEIPQLEWLKPESKYCVRTQCRRYSCAKVIICGKATYELWALDLSGSWFAQVAVGLSSFDEAKKRAQAHLQKRMTGRP